MFKCFAELTIPVRALTLLAGANGSGKSTVLQGLLLTHQALNDARGQPSPVSTIPLSGELLSTGTMRDVVNKAHGGDSFGIGLTTDALQIDWSMTAAGAPRDALVANVTRTSWSSLHSPQSSSDGLGLFPTPLLELKAGLRVFERISRIRYVPADRVGPIEAYPLLHPEKHRCLGPRAVGAIGAMYWNRDVPVAPVMRHPATSQARLDRQVEGWLGEVFPGARLDMQRVQNAELVTLGVSTGQSDFHRPQNVGFGISYVLPVFIAILASKPGDLVIIDSPEAHLHPRGQVAVTRLAAAAAAAGVQVLMETHSDHVLNAVRVAVHQNRISPQSVGVLFFSRASPDGEAQWRDVRIDSLGRFDAHPDGFFDEMDRQLTELLRPQHE